MNFVANDPDVLSTEECAVFPCLTKFAGGPEHDFAAPAYASRPEMAATMAGRADRKVPGRVGMSTIGYRFDWLKTKRAYAIAKLADSGESHALDRHYVTLHQPLIFLRRL
jgi:hypothetical protein